jgi:muramoyltetrapeptide carboxypeptidase LdcA involved in peptidoglycan recycling
MIIPTKLREGDEIRIISPSRSLGIISKEQRLIACARLQELGLTVTFSKHAEEQDVFNSSSIQSRVEDLHEAFSDKRVKGILTTIGGFNVNQLLSYLDYKCIRANPKILCGYSDITALQNAMYVKTGLVTYSGPHFSTFGMQKGIEYTLDYFKRCFMSIKPFTVTPSAAWSDDEWYKDQNKRKFMKNEGYFVIHEGSAQGTILGGNLCTLNLLQGTSYMPNLKNTILFIEDDEESKPKHFDRDLQSLIHQPDFTGVRGIIIGRFQRASGMTDELLAKIINSKQELDNIPIIAGVDFGHTTPHMTFPIGGTGSLMAKKDKVDLQIHHH